jgi:hypothetical protein
MPKTLATSCGSAATAVVPRGSTVRTNSSTHSLVDSRCMWASTKPGGHGGPVQVDLLEGLTAAPTGHHPVGDGEVGGDPFPGGGDRTRPPRRRRSAGSSPRATARTWGDDGARHAACIVAASGAPSNPRSERGLHGGVGGSAVVTLRPMTEADVPGPSRPSTAGSWPCGPLRAARHRQLAAGRAPPAEPDRHFLATDPVARGWPTTTGSSWGCPSPSCARTTGCSPNSAPCRAARAGAWAASSCAWPSPTATHRSPGTIQCSRDPKAMALYSSFGFSSSGRGRLGALRPAR